MNEIVAKVLFAAPEGQYLLENIARLRGEGFDITICHNAAEVLAYFEAGRENPDLVFFSNTLPHGKEFDDVLTLKGTATGRALFARLQCRPECDVEFVIATHSISEARELLDLNQFNLSVLDIKPGELDDALNTMIGMIFTDDFETDQEETSMCPHQC